MWTHKAEPPLRPDSPGPSAGSPDPLLFPFLREGEERETLSRLDELTRTAEPLIQSVVRSKLRPSLCRQGVGGESLDIEDVQGEIRFRLIRRLRQMKADPGRFPIRNFQQFVARTASHACNDLLRRRNPARVRLRDQLNYLSLKDSDSCLDIWKGDDGVLVCGVPTWRPRPVSPEAERRSRQILDRPEILKDDRPEVTDLPLAGLVSELFRWIGGPVELNSIIRLILLLQSGANAPGKSTPLHGDPDRPPDPYECLPDPGPGTGLRVERRDDLRLLWGEILQLRAPQRAALLLNLPEIRLFEETGIAGREEIARALSLPAREFAALWPHLPLDDARLSRWLGLTPLQVIGLRRGARERLLRRGRGGENVSRRKPLSRS